jgi:hypothetical protein
MSERKQGPYAADDFAEIRKHLERVQGRAWVEPKPFIPVAGGSAQGATPIKVADKSRCVLQERRYNETHLCWCYHAAPDGSSFPCPSRPVTYGTEQKGDMYRG